MNKLPPIIANDYNLRFTRLVRVGYFTHAKCPAQDGLLIVTNTTWNETLHCMTSSSTVWPINTNMELGHYIAWHHHESMRSENSLPCYTLQIGQHQDESKNLMLYTHAKITFRVYIMHSLKQQGGVYSSHMILTKGNKFMQYAHSHCDDIMC